MDLNEKLHGFTVTEKRYVRELECYLYVLKYDKNGARLVFLDREDENKTFSISFRTPPTDSTGVFHILEHSVLCGSEKFPLKDPFVELLKGSLNTFLNAMTFQDKTMYPVASRNDRDFYNLVNVYMDAVLHPLAVKSPNAFYQEGWHYELDESGRLSYKGVVLNEMRGEYSSPETVADRHLNEMLYPDTCYREDSGGDPDLITSLTYEDFVAAHKKYYHPTGAELFLDGSVNLSEILPLLDSYLSEYEKREEPLEGINPQPMLSPAYRNVKYEIPEGESAENKTRVCLGYIFSRFDEQKKLFAANVLFSTLFSNNESPVKEKIISSGICEDVLVGIHDGVYEPSVTVDLVNVKDGMADEALRVFFDALESVLSDGIDEAQLTASLNAMEFKLRERDFGSLPLGVANAMISLESLLYSDDPMQNLCYEDSLCALRGEGAEFYASLLREIFIDNERRAILVMDPSATLGEEREKREREKLEKIARGMTDAEKNAILALNAELSRWQDSEDSEEALSKIPRLCVSDIPREAKKTDTEELTILGQKLLCHSISTRGIVYTDLYFDISDVSERELPYVFLLTAALTNLPTASYSVLELQALIKEHLGSFDVRTTALTRDGEAKVYLQVSVSALESKKEKIFEITSHLLTKTLFEDSRAVKNLVRQTVIANEESFVQAGHQAALGRACAKVSVEAAVREYYSGYESHIAIKDIDRNFDAEWENIRAQLSALSARFFVRPRLLVSVAGCRDEGFLENLVKIAPSGEKVAPVCKIQPLPMRSEGILIPAQVAFAASAYNVILLGEEPIGSFDVVRALVGYEYLWGAVRVRGGAYGAGMVAGISGNLSFYSYRDPTPKRTLACFSSVAEFLRSFAKGGGDISKYIIGAIGESEPIRTPRMRASLATVKYLRGIDYSRTQRNRDSILSTDGEEILRIAEIVNKCTSRAAICVVGGKEKLSELEDTLDVILQI